MQHITKIYIGYLYRANEAQRVWLKDSVKHITQKNPKFTQSECSEYLSSITPMMEYARNFQNLCKLLYNDNYKDMKEKVHHQACQLWSRSVQGKIVLKQHIKNKSNEKPKSKSKTPKTKKPLKPSFQTPSQLKRKFSKKSTQPKKRTTRTRKLTLTETGESDNEVDVQPILNEIEKRVQTYVYIIVN